jgi:hypothetical protein
MLDFDYFRGATDAYQPRTVNAALRAAEAHLLPIEACVYLGTSIKPLDEEPIDLAAIDQVLSRPRLDLDTNLLLMRILSKLLRNFDVEVALFAATPSVSRRSRPRSKKKQITKSCGPWPGSITNLPGFTRDRSATSICGRLSGTSRRSTSLNVWAGRTSC